MALSKPELPALPREDVTLAGPQLAELSRRLVQVLRREVGRGPTQAKSFWAGDDLLVTLFGDVFLRAGGDPTCASAGVGCRGRARGRAHGRRGHGLRPPRARPHGGALRLRASGPGCSARGNPTERGGRRSPAGVPLPPG